MNQAKTDGKDEEYISIMTDPDLHPLPITPNDPLSIVSFKSIFTCLFFSSKPARWFKVQPEGVRPI